MVWTYYNTERNPGKHPILQGEVEGKISRGRPAKQWLDDVKELTWLSSNDIWKEPEDRVAWRKLPSHITPVYCIVYTIKDSKRWLCCQITKY